MTAFAVAKPWAGATIAPAWLVIVGAGFGLFYQYKGNPGAVHEPPARLSALGNGQGASRPQLVLFLHPRCPCSHATVAELARVMAHAGSGRLTVTIYFCRPDEAVPPWEPTDLWRQAEIIPGVTVRWDEDGRQAKRFGARTSGHAVLYDSSGQLCFHGGLTSARGHEGDSSGLQAVLDFLTKGSNQVRMAAVFGCPLIEPTRRLEDREP